MMRALFDPEGEGGQSVGVTDDVSSPAVYEKGRDRQAVIVTTNRLRNRSSGVASQVTARSR
jgi:hypothetical protein